MKRLIWQALDFYRAVAFTGFGDAWRLSRASAARGQRFEVKPKTWGAPFTIRGGTSDAWVFQHVAVCKEYPIVQDRPVKRIIDAGANIGTTARCFRSYYPDAEIVSIEADAENFEILQQNTRHDSKVDTVHAALWHHSGFVRFVEPGDMKYALRVEETDAQSGIRSLTVDDVMKQQGWDDVDLIKIDIEGAERELFGSGDCGWLDRVGVVMIELHEGPSPGCASALFSAFGGRDFRLDIRGGNLILSQPPREASAHD